MMLLSEAAIALQAQMDGDDVRFDAVSTDTRTTQQGDLFIALRGEHFDGALFISQAVKAGAVAAVINSDSVIDKAPCAIVRVPDTRLALGKLAGHWRKQFNIPLVAITGSNGKTTVKEMLATILSMATEGNSRYIPDSGVGIMTSPTHPHRTDCVSQQRGTVKDESVLATRGNFNNDIGMPLTLLRLRASHQYAVIEMGMNHPNEIDYLTHIAQPDVALINNATGAHLLGLGSIEGVAHAKGEIFAGLKKEGTAIINADDVFAALWRNMAGTHRIVDFALEHQATVKGVWKAQGYGGVLHALTQAGELNAVLQVPGEHNALNALAATSAALALQVPLEIIAKALEGFTGVAGRLQRKQALQGAMLIDDTYNANPASMHAALEVLAQAPGKRILVLGDMGELGSDAAKFHQEIGIAARELGIEQIFALGTLSIEAVREFSLGAQHFTEMKLLIAALENELDEQTTVLVKGSRFMKMERVVQFCALHKEEECSSH